MGGAKMTKKERLHEKIKNNPKSVTFAEMKKLLEQNGFIVENNSGGSHYIVYHPDADFPMKPLPYQRPHLKSYLVKEMLAYIDYIRSGKK